MLKYDNKQKLLNLYKVKNPDMGDRFDLLKDIKDAFKRFETEGALEACECINEHLKTVRKCDDRFVFEITKEPGFRNEPEHVKIKARVYGDKIRESITVVSLPYMDNLGKLHFFDRSVKALVNRLVSSNDISYDAERGTLSIVMDKKTVKISQATATKDLRVHGRSGNTIFMSELIQNLSVLEGDKKDVASLIRNALLLSHMPISVRYTGPLPISQLMLSDSTGLIEGLRENPDYKVSKLRDSINSAVSLNRAIGEILSRDVAGYSAGTYISPTILSDIKKQRVNEIYVKSIVPFPDKKIASGLSGELLMFTRIPKGTENTTFLRTILPEWEETSIFTEDVYLPNTSYGRALDFSGSMATSSVLETLQSLGCKGVMLKSGYDGIVCPFEMEIISNYTVKYGEIYSSGECVSMGVDPADWAATKPGANSELLTSDDLLAIYSTLGYMQLKGTNLFMNRDKDFLKKVELADIALKNSLESAIRSHMRQFGDNVKKYAEGSRTLGKSIDVFSGLTSMLKEDLSHARLIETVDSTNLVAEISQATHITNNVKNAPEIMRHVALPYLGRICPFETPEGKKLGLVNNKAIGCHIVNGDMLSPVRRVIQEGDFVKLSSEIEELSVRDEVKYRITSELQLVPSDREGYYKNTRVIAKVTNPSSVGERVKFSTVYASDLDYVYAHTEGLISAATSMIPFACHDDAVRASFGTKMIKSAIYLLDPSKPSVQTSMYNRIFDSTDAYLIRAKGDGEVISVSTGLLAVHYDGDIDDTEYRVDEFKVTKDSVLFMRYKVGEGQRVHKGQILADSSASADGVYCPGRTELCAYMPTGRNYEDAIDVSERTTIDYISIGTHSMLIPKKDKAVISNSGLYKYYTRGDVITEITERDNSHEESKKIRAEHHAGIWYNVGEISENGKKSFKLDLLGYNRLTGGDKLSGLHGNKGVSSMDIRPNMESFPDMDMPSDIEIVPNSEAPMLANGMSIRFVLNPHGLPSRMNTGQILGGHAGLIANVLGIRINSDAYNGATVDEIHMLMKMTSELTNCTSKEAMESKCKEYDVPEELTMDIVDNYDNIIKWANTFDEYGDARIWDPVTGTWFEDKITIAMPTILKMKQEAEEKIHARGGIFEGTYQTTTSQPPKGSKAGGGQAWGEMEMWAILAYGATELLHEAWNEKSDNEVARVNMELKAAGDVRQVPDKYNYPRSLYNFLYYMQCFGIQLTDDEQRLPDTTADTSKHNFVFNVERIVKEDDSTPDDDTTEEAVDEIMKALFS